MITLFFVGIVEMMIIAVWTKLVTDNKIWASGVVTVINIITWYYVLQTILEDIGNWQLIVVYALGCAIGTMATAWYFQVQEKKQAKALIVEPVSIQS